MTQTHSAHRYGIVKPGLTLRDIRIAVLLENILHSPINRTTRNPDFKHTTTRDNNTWPNLLLEYCNHYSKMTGEFYHCASFYGNNDWKWVSHGSYEKAFGPRDYTFNYANCTFICVSPAIRAL